MNFLLDTVNSCVLEGEKTYYDLFSDFIFPSLVTVATIIFSVVLSRNEFNKTKRHEEFKRSEEDKALKKLISRNLRVVSDQILIDIENFKKQFVERYNLEYGFLPQGMLLTFPELLSLSSIDTFRYEKLYLENESTTEKINQLYLTIGCIQSSLKSYEKLDEEINKINSYIADIEVPLLKFYRQYTDELGSLILKFLEGSSTLDVKIENDIRIMGTLIDTYESDINNPFELKRNIEKLEKVDAYDTVIESSENLLPSYKYEFLALYFKLQQEIFLFHNRVEFLTNRLRRNSIQFDKFLES